jgi:hypothetical protein
LPPITLEALFLQQIPLRNIGTALLVRQSYIPFNRRTLRHSTAQQVLLWHRPDYFQHLKFSIERSVVRIKQVLSQTQKRLGSNDVGFILRGRPHLLRTTVDLVPLVITLTTIITGRSPSSKKTVRATTRSSELHSSRSAPELANQHIQDAAESDSPCDSTPLQRALAGELSTNYLDIHTHILSAHIRLSDTYVQSQRLPGWMLLWLPVCTVIGCERRQ